MRLPRPRRVLALLALAAAAITCTDAPTAPSAAHRGTSARIGLTPRLSADAARAYGGLARLGLDVASVHLRLTSLSGRVATDTVIAFPARQDTLRLDLAVQIDGSEETFTALLELRDASGVVLFSGTQLVTARAGALPGTAAPSFPLEYAGPGRAARTLTLSPAAGSVPATAVVPLTASAVDSAGDGVGDVLVSWSSSDSSLAAVASTGAAAGELRGTGKRGEVTITAVTPTGISASATLTLVPPATRLTVAGGAGQTGVAGRALAQPFVVELHASDGGPVPNAVVEFRALGGGSVGTSSVATDSQGRAATTMTLGRAAGTYEYAATSGALGQVTVAATATAAPASTVTLVSGDGQSDVVGTTLERPLVVLVTDEFGTPVPGATVEWTQVAGFGSLDATRSTTGADGRASVQYTLGYRASVDVVRASLQGVASAGVDFTLRSRAGGASRFVVRHLLASTIAVGTTSNDTLRVQLADAGGNFVAQAGVVVTATGVLSAGGAPAFSVTATSDANGTATFDVPAYVGPVGSLVVTITAPGLATLTLPPVAIVTGSVARLRIKTQPSLATSSGAPFAVQPEVKLYDVGWNDVRKSGVSVTAYVASGGGTLGGTTVAVTDVSGTATFTDLALVGAAGTEVLGFSTGTVPDVQSDPITLSAGASALEAMSGWLAPTTAVNGSPISTFKVRLVDASGVPVARAGVPVTVSAAALAGATPTAPLVGTLTRLTDASGVAVFDDVAFSTVLGDYTLSATSDANVLALPTLTLVPALTVTN